MVKIFLTIQGRSSTVTTPNQTPDAQRRPISPQSSLSSMPAG